MCGIAGLLDFGGADREMLLGAAVRMGAALRHRGPDASGVWADPSAGIALGHTRLAVVELSELGRQPMESACGRWVTVFNGEIYNFKVLRKELQERGHAFRGHSDTEVLLAAVSEWGLAGALSRFVGMFAFALWDRRERTLSLARDRVGEKPLYYGELGRAFVFGSDLSAIRAHSAGAWEIDPNALAAYVRFGYVPAPHSIYSNIRKLPPGCFLTVGDGDETLVRYWSVEDVARAGAENPITCDAEEAANRLEALLSDAVSLQTFADVPVGAFLSGGTDSATVVAMMCRHARRVRTFTIGFAEKRYDESAHARAVAQYLGTEHTEYQVTPADAMNVIPKLPEIYAEPFADASQIPTWLVSQLARRSVTVSLSGDGADELFGGYDRYSWAETIWRSIRAVPGSVRRLSGDILAALPAQAGRVHKLAPLVSAGCDSDLYLKLISHWRDPHDVVERGIEPAIPRGLGLQPFRHRMMLLDTLTYLPDDILVKLDRASMANSLEARAPFLDHRLIEFAWRLPLAFKCRNGEPKWLLRKVLHRHVPAALVDRPKAGFAIPLDAWIRGPLRDWAEELLDARRLRSEGFFRPEPIRRRWCEHLSGAQNWIAPLWVILTFQAWYAHQRSVPTPDLMCEAVR